MTRVNAEAAPAQTPKREKRDVHGWVVLDKPMGMSSTHAVSVVKRLFHWSLEPRREKVAPPEPPKTPKTIHQDKKERGFLARQRAAKEARAGRRTGKAGKA